MTELRREAERERIRRVLEGVYVRDMYVGLRPN